MTGKVRIIGGQWRGRRLVVPDRPGLRPTGDRARETLFNWLAPHLPGARCLDLFAGTGALGLEAASRSAAAVTLVEQDAQLAGRLREIASQWPGGEVLDVVCADARSWLGGDRGPFDLVFVDPPFAAGMHAVVLEALARPGLLSDDGLVYVEGGTGEDAAEAAESASAPCLADVVGADGRVWHGVRDKTIGRVRMRLLGRRAAA